MLWYKCVFEIELFIKNWHQELMIRLQMERNIPAPGNLWSYFGTKHFDTINSFYGGDK